MIQCQRDECKVITILKRTAKTWGYNQCLYSHQYGTAGENGFSAGMLNAV